MTNMTTESKRKLIRQLEAQGWTLVDIIGKVWTMENGYGDTAKISVTAYNDGRQADYEIIEQHVAEEADTTANEAKRVSDREFDEAYAEMCANLKELTNGEYDGYNRIQFHFDYDRDAQSDEKPWKRPKAMQVNWAAIGTVMPSEAATFAQALGYAAELAAGFKYNGCKVYYED